MVSMMPTLNEGFTNGSLRGSYAMTRIGQGGAHQSAGLGVYTFDGQGGLTGTIMANVPGFPFGQRARAIGRISGTYTINPDGSGYGSTRETITLADGAVNEFTTTVLITRATAADGPPLAQEVTFMEDAVDPVTGCIHFNFATRHPDDGAFSLASFRGTYGGPGVGQGGDVPASAIGIGAVNFDGQGNFTAVDVQNLPGGLFTQRQNATFDTENGRYEVNPDGTGMIIAPSGQAPMVITRVQVAGGVRMALEYFFVTDALHPPTGNLVTTRVSRRMPV
jgi:hypothetical protein